MHRFFQRISPPFLQKLDQHLLVNRPGLWATRIHYLLFFLAAAYGLAGLLVYAQPMHLDNLPDFESTSILLAVLSGLAFLLWAIQLVHYQPWKQGEKSWRLHSLRDQGVYALGLLFLFTLPFTYISLFQHRKAHLVETPTLIQELNTLHRGEAYLRHLDSYHYFNLEQNQLPYQHYSTPEDLPLSSAGELVREIEAVNAPRQLQDLHAYQEVASRYAAWPEGLPVEDLFHSYQTQSPLTDVQGGLLRELQYQVGTQIQDLQKAQFQPLAWNDYAEVMLPIVLTMLLLLFIVVRSSWKQLFLSLVIALGLLIAEAILIGLLNRMVNGDDQFLILIVYFLNLIGMGIYGFAGSVKNNRQEFRRTIALILFTGLCVGLPAMFAELVQHAPDSMVLLSYNVGIVLTMVLWNLLIQGRLLQLVTNPKAT